MTRSPGHYHTTPPFFCVQGSVEVDGADDHVRWVRSHDRVAIYHEDAEPTDLEVRFVDKDKLRAKCTIAPGEAPGEMYDRQVALTPAERVVWREMQKWDFAVELTWLRFQWD